MEVKNKMDEQKEIVTSFDPKTKTGKSTIGTEWFNIAQSLSA